MLKRYIKNILSYLGLSISSRKDREIMSFQKIGFVIIFIGLVIAMPAGTDTPLNNSITTASSSAQPTTQLHQGYWITVDTLPLGTHYEGDSFTVSGETNLPVGQEIDFGAYFSRFEPGSPELLPPSATGSTLVTEGRGEIHYWSLVIDTTRFWKHFRNGTVARSDAVAGDYTLSIGSLGNNLYPFTLIENPRASAESPTRVASPSPASQITSQPTTVPSTLPVTLPIAALGICIIIGTLYRR